jgi:hypothetical protein
VEASVKLQQWGRISKGNSEEDKMHGAALCRKAHATTYHWSSFGWLPLEQQLAVGARVLLSVSHQGEGKRAQKKASTHPARRIMATSSAHHGTTPGTSTHPGPRQRGSFLAHSPLSHSSTPLVSNHRHSPQPHLYSSNLPFTASAQAMPGSWQPRQLVKMRPMVTIACTATPAPADEMPVDVVAQRAATAESAAPTPQQS